MSRLEPSVYLRHIRAESARFLEVLRTCRPDAHVPACPDWDAADLLWHLTEVQDSWEHVVRTRPAAPTDHTGPRRPVSYDALLALFEERHRAFTAVLEAADPADPAWSWSEAPEHHDVAFTYRRQAHEALIHRLDAEQAAGRETAPIDAALAADGVEECLDVMFGASPSWGRFTPGEHYVEYRLTDVGASVWTRLGTFTGTAPDGTEHDGEPDQHVVASPGGPAAVVVSGTAADVDAWLWHRDPANVVVTGPAEIRDAMYAVIGQAID